jgi:DNA-binding XRE family transcriptional regulator
MSKLSFNTETTLHFIRLFVNYEAPYCGPMGIKPQKALTSLQCRMARAGLRWGVRELSARAGVGQTTIVKIERENGTVHPAMLAALRQAFEAAGVIFLNGDGVRVREIKAHE